MVRRPYCLIHPHGWDPGETLREIEDARRDGAPGSDLLMDPGGPIPLVPVRDVVARWGRWCPTVTADLTAWIRGMVQVQFAGALYAMTPVPEYMVVWGHGAGSRVLWTAGGFHPLDRVELRIPDLPEGYHLLPRTSPS